MDPTRWSATQLRWATAGGIVGPVVFVTGWMLNGLRYKASERIPDGYSAIDNAISELAATGSPAQWGMTFAFVVFSVGIAAYSQALRVAFAGPAWVAALVCALSTLGVAATPLDATTRDALHGTFATLGYIGITLAPFFAGRTIAEARPGSHVARLCWLASAISAAALLGTLADTSHGFFQRSGLFAGDVWFVASAAWLLRTGGDPLGRGLAQVGSGTGTGGGGPT